MRSRYQHDGSVDFHAESEHEILRRAEEALERQRQAAHATAAVSPVVPMGMPMPSRPTGAAGSAVPAPQFPHEEIAARLAPKPTPITTSEAGLAWPTSPSPSTSTSRARARRR